MSLINDALKKAQQLQTQGQAHSTSSGQAPTPPHPDVTPNAPGQPADSMDSTRSPQAHSTGSGQAGSARASLGHDRSTPGQLFLLLAFGAGVLIALSVLATVYLLRKPAMLSPAGAAAPVVAQAPATLNPTGATAPAGPEKPAPAPVITAPPPTLSLPVVSLPNPSNGPVVSVPNPPNPSNGSAPAQNSAPIPAPAVEKLPAATPPTTAPAVAAAPTPAITPTIPVASPFVLPPAPSPSNEPDSSRPDPKILAYLDALQIAGIRMSGTGNKVLMNDRVYRENEIVDHLLGLRLKKVESDTLTFVDERGVTYTKNF
jgi:hypothetical protein